MGLEPNVQGSTSFLPGSVGDTYGYPGFRGWEGHFLTVGCSETGSKVVGRGVPT